MLRYRLSVCADMTQSKVKLEPSSSRNDASSGNIYDDESYVTRNSAPTAMSIQQHDCNICGKILSSHLTLKRHKQQQHFSPLHSAICALCNKVFRTLNSLNNHKSIYHRRQKFSSVRNSNNFV